MDTLHERIRKVRGDIPREEFAKLLKISSSALYNYESGNRVPHVEMILRICEEGNVNLLWILQGRGPVYKSDWSEIYWKAAENVVHSVLKVAGADIRDKARLSLIEVVQELLRKSLEVSTGSSTDVEADLNEDKDLTDKIIDASSLFANRQKTAKNILTAHGGNNIQTVGNISGGINIKTTTKKVDVAVQPPPGTIGADPFLMERIRGMFNELGLRREERFGKTAYPVMYNEFKKAFSIPRTQKYTAYQLWPASRGEEIINYLQDKLDNTIKGRNQKAADRKGHTGPYLLAESNRLHELLGWTEQEYKARLRSLFGVTSRADLNLSQLTNYIAYLREQIDG